MDINSNSPPQENTKLKAAFRKPTADSANRKYRHHSPVDSSSSDGSPMRKHSLSPVSLKEEAKVSNFQSRKDDRSDARGSNRNQHGRSNDSYEYSSRSSQGYSLRDGHSRHGKHADEDDRNYSRLSSRSAREPRGSSHSDYKEREGDYIMSRDHHGDGDKYTRDKSDSMGYTSKDKEREKPSQDYRKFRYKDSSSDRRHDKLTAEENRYDDRDRHVRDRDNRDGKRDYSWSSRGHKGDRTTFYGEYTGRRGDTDSERDGGGYHMKESFRGEAKELDSKKEKKKYDGQDINRNKDAPGTELGERFEKGSGFASEIEESAAKRHKLFNLDKYTDQRTEGSKHVQEPVGKVTADHPPVICSESATNVNAAKVAAMKAAELVNKDLLGTGVMTADQKKKLLWGNKKNSSSEESSHRWDATLFSDRDRQEKFNKLMSLRLPWYPWPIVGCEGRSEGGAATHERRWNRSPSCREAEGTSTRFREAVHCWTSTERRPHCRVRSLILFLVPSLSNETMSRISILVLSVLRISCLLILYIFQHLPLFRIRVFAGHFRHLR